MKFQKKSIVAAPKKKLTLLLPEETYKNLQIIALDQNSTISNLIVKWTKDHDDLLLQVGKRILKNSVVK
jgi:hypothetical protein